MKCETCEKELIPLTSEKSSYVCPKCSRIYHEDEIQKMKDIEMLDEDMEIWRETRTWKK